MRGICKMKRKVIFFLIFLFFASISCMADKKDDLEGSTEATVQNEDSGKDRPENPDGDGSKSQDNTKNNQNGVKPTTPPTVDSGGNGGKSERVLNPDDKKTVDDSDKKKRIIDKDPKIPPKTSPKEVKKKDPKATGGNTEKQRDNPLFGDYLSEELDPPKKNQGSETNPDLSGVHNADVTSSDKTVTLKKNRQKSNNQLAILELNKKIKNLEHDIFKMDIFIIILLFCFIVTLGAIIFFIPILFKKNNDVKTSIKKIDAKISDIERKHTNPQITTNVRRESNIAVISRGSQNEGKVYRSEVLHTEKKDFVEKLPVISSLYNNKNERDIWREKREDVEFLNIAAKVFMQIQRNETVRAILLEKTGTWINSKFVLKGEYLYLNFNFYNETRQFSFEYREDEQLLRKMYAIVGNIPGNIIECSPAKVVKGAEGYQVVKQGKLLLS